MLITPKAGTTSEGDGAVVTRDRNQARDVWRIGTDPSSPPYQDPPTPSNDWFLVETNYGERTTLVSFSLPSTAEVISKFAHTHTRMYVSHYYYSNP
jgi:hypothetical protein